MRLPLLAFGLGAGQIAGASHKEGPPMCMLESRGQAGLLVRVYYIQQVRGGPRYRCIFPRFSTFQSASGFTAAALAIDSSGKTSSGR